jgi:hypothetical protein
MLNTLLIHYTVFNYLTNVNKSCSTNIIISQAYKHRAFEIVQKN